jgi:sugar lactone lactonase YvrE
MVENLAVAPDGSVFVTVYSANRIDRYDPRTGKTGIFAALPGPPMGLALDESGSLWITGGTMRAAPGYIWKVNVNGVVQNWTKLPEATFMNGCAVHPNGRELLVCESFSNRVLSINLQERNKWSVWLENELLGSKSFFREPMASRSTAVRHISPSPRSTPLCVRRS